MTDFAKKITTLWQDSINVLLGLWLVAAPWVLGYTAETYAAWNAWGVGVAIAIVAVALIVSYQAWAEWINVALGAWLVTSPWALGYAGLEWAVWNQVGVGLIVGVLALWSAMSDHDETALSAS